MKPCCLPHAAHRVVGGGAISLPVLWDAPPVSPSPSFSSIFHSSCFLHKAGVSRDSSQMFSAAHHIAFLMKYSCSLSAFRRESLLQLPALETLHRQHSCKAAQPGLPAPRSTPSCCSSFLFLLAQAATELELHPLLSCRRGITKSHMLGSLVSSHGCHAPQGGGQWVAGRGDSSARGMEGSHPSPATTALAVAELEPASAGVAPVRRRLPASRQH